MDQQELHETGYHSPRQKFELEAELQHFEALQNQENPFSFYGGADEREQEENHQQQILQEQTQNHENTEHANNVLTVVQASKDLAQVVNIEQTPHQKTQEQQIKKKQLHPVKSIKVLKEGEFDISKMPAPKIQSIPVVQDKIQQESNYQKQIANDLQDLKKSMKDKESKKFKIFNSPLHLNLNKTFAPIKSRQTNESEMEIQQMRMLVKMAFEKKKANYEMLIQWDRKRAESMALHGRMIELLQGEIDLRIKSSLQNFQKYQTFFREKAKQEEKYVNSPVINTRYALQGNSLSRNVYINCSVILNSLCDENAARCRKISDFILLIRGTILKELTQSHLSSSQKELLRVRQKISTLRSSLKKYNQQTEQKTIELGNLFKEQSGNITSKFQKDFYRTQLSFLRKAHAQIDVQKKLGQYCLEYYHTAVQQQLKRSSVIREAMLTYSQGLKTTYNLQLQLTLNEQMSKHEQLRLIEQYFSLQEMFDARILELFKAHTHINQQITIESFTDYINQFGHEPFDSRVILLKEFSVKMVSGGKAKQQMQQNCYLGITVDNFLHLTFGQGTYSKPDITIKISQKGLDVRTGRDQIVDIVKKQEKRNSMISYFWDSKNQRVFRLKFAKKDNKEEFMDYITKLMADNY